MTTVDGAQQRDARGREGRRVPRLDVVQRRLGEPTDDYLIEVIADNKPVVKVVKPGRDWRASNIEEVTVRVEANDDFGLDRVEVRYSVNGGEWQTAPLDVDGNGRRGPRGALSRGR